MAKTALVTGGKGYLGSHVCKVLKQNGWEVVIYEDCGRKYVHSYYDEVYAMSDIRNKDRLQLVFDRHKIDTVFHFAGRIEVGESMKYPTYFWDVNVGGTSNLLDVMNYFDVRKILFSSTAAVYEPTPYSLSENSAFGNNSVYANTKIACERMIKDSGFKYGIFRYFNLAGASLDGEIGENHLPETHLIPNIFSNNQDFTINGNDYKTIDGTCIRDYVHVCDVADAHLLGLDYINKTEKSFTLNLGTGVGISVLEIIHIIEKETGMKIHYKFGERRNGDPDILVANINEVKKVLGYKPKHDIVSIIKTAYQWHLNQEKK
jgi:UDP-glucose 4-epimerase